MNRQGMKGETVMENTIMQKMDLSRMKPGEKGKVICIQGGRGVVDRLEALGVRPGSVLKMVASQPGGGPVVIQVDNTQAAIGFGMASKIMMELEPAVQTEPGIQGNLK